MSDEPKILSHTAFLERLEVLRGGGGGGTSSDMDQRVTRLEEQARVSAERLQSIDTKLDGVKDLLARQPTRTEQLTYLIGAAAIGLSFMALLIAGMSWLDARQEVPASSPAPIVITVPAAQSPSP